MIETATRQSRLCLTQTNGGKQRWFHATRSLRASHAGVKQEECEKLAKPKLRRTAKKTTLVFGDLPNDLPPLPDLTTSTPSTKNGKIENGTKPRKKRMTKTTLIDSDLPQGLVSSPVVPLPDLPEMKDTPQYPTVILQAQRNMTRFPNCVVLTRVGGFYELYLTHATEYGPLLNLKVATKKTNAGPVPMAGFPFFQLEKFLKTLVMDLGKYVAIAEEFPWEGETGRLKGGGLMHDRRVARVVTPGTLIDESFLEGSSDNFVLGIHAEPLEGDGGTEGGIEEELGLAWLDLSTGAFHTQPVAMAGLSAALSRIAPREVVLDERLKGGKNGLTKVLREEQHLSTFCSSRSVSEDSASSPWEALLASTVQDHSTSFSDAEIRAGKLALAYVKDRLQGADLQLQTPIRYLENQVMAIDRATFRGLEIKENFRDGTLSGTLLHVLNRTKTSGGGRLLKSWLGAPSTDVAVINGRLDIVEVLLRDEGLREKIQHRLTQCYDLQRLVQKFALGRGDADDLLGLAATLDASTKLAGPIEDNSLEDGELSKNALTKLVQRIQHEETVALAAKIRKSIDEEGLEHQHEIENVEAGEVMKLAESVASSTNLPSDVVAFREGRGKRKLLVNQSLRDHYGEDKQPFIMKPTASVTLRRLHKELSTLLQQKSELTTKYEEEYGLKAGDVTLKWTPATGHIVHLKGKVEALPSLLHNRVLSKSKSTRTLHLPAWSELGSHINSLRLSVRAEEARVFNTLRTLVIKNLVPLRRTASVLDELDVYTSFAFLAASQSLTRPTLNTSTTSTIMAGRHPTVDPSLRIQGRSFVPNDLVLKSEIPHVLTGPNMGGKSTFLRQSALLHILAQIGSYIPATYAELGIVDKLFARIGSADDLYRDQSTFMLEMLEVSNILRLATGRSLVIMDEVGRGTSPTSGEAVSYATLDHLVRGNRCRTLFATHFHSLGDMAGKGAIEVEEWCTGLSEDEDGGFSYLYKLKRGVNRESHALKVARLAGMPESAIKLAKKLIEEDVD